MRRIAPNQNQIFSPFFIYYFGRNKSSLAGSKFLRKMKKRKLISVFVVRKIRDSNPRYGCPYTCTPNMRLRPLGQSSIDEFCPDPESNRNYPDLSGCPRLSFQFAPTRSRTGVIPIYRDVLDLVFNLPRPGVEPGLQSSQDCVLSTERPEQQDSL